MNWVDHNKIHQEHQCKQRASIREESYEFHPMKFECVPGLSGQVWAKDIYIFESCQATGSS
jgi:hypothetical protein